MPLFDSVKIRNFRCFASADAVGLGRLTVIVGKNGSGKTAFLEAVFLCSGVSPELALRMRGLRGAGDVLRVAVSDPVQSASLFDDLFYQFGHDQDVSVSFGHKKDTVRSMRIAYEPANRKVRIPTAAADAPSTVLPLRFTWKTAQGKQFVHVPKLTEAGLEFGSAGEIIKGAFVSSGTLGGGGSTELAQRFSDLSRRHETEEVLEVVRELFPNIVGLSVELSAGQPILFAAMKGVAEKIPIGLVSTGMTKLVGLLVNIAACAGGVVLIDEIENGFYYRTFPTVWRAVYRFASKFDTQVIASTHSREALSSLTEPLADQADDLALLRADSTDIQQPIRSFTGEQLLDAVRNDVEVR